MVGERFPKQKVLPGTVQEAPQDCAEGVPRSLCRRSPLCTDFDTRNLQKMGAERFPRHESLTKHQETPRRSKKSISQRTCRIREKAFAPPDTLAQGGSHFSCTWCLPERILPSGRPFFPHRLRLNEFTVLARESPPPEWIRAGFSRPVDQVTWPRNIKSLRSEGEPPFHFMEAALPPVRGPGGIYSTRGGTPAIAAGGEIAYRHRSVR